MNAMTNWLGLILAALWTLSACAHAVVVDATFNSPTDVAVTAASYTATGNKRGTAVLTGEAHSLALCSDGTLVSWGYNDGGRLGNDTHPSRRSKHAVDRFRGSTNKPLARGSRRHQSFLSGQRNQRSLSESRGPGFHLYELKPNR